MAQDTENDKDAIKQNLIVVKKNHLVTNLDTEKQPRTSEQPTPSTVPVHGKPKRFLLITNDNIKPRKDGTNLNF